MRLFERYVLRELVIVTALVTLTLTLAIWLTQSLRFIELIVSRGMSLESYLYLTLLLLPRFLSLMLPLSLFTAVLFTYNKLISDSELVVLRGIGLSPFQLARPALLLAAAVVVIGYLLSLYMLPWSYRQFKDMEHSLRSDYSAVLLKEGTFNNVADGITIYVRSRELDGELQGILIHDNRDLNRTFTLIAESGRLTTAEASPRIILVNGNRQEVDPKSGKLSMLYFDRYSVDLGRVGQVEESRFREPRERYISELLFHNENPIDRANSARLWAEAHNRLSSPLLALTFTLISLAALLSGEFSRRGQSRRVLVAVALGGFLQVSTIATNNILVRWPEAAPIPYLSIVLVIIATLYSMNRNRPWRWPLRMQSRASNDEHPAV